MEKLSTERYYQYQDIIKSCEIVKNFVKSKKLIIYGGEAIHYSLLKFGKKLYEDYEIPDYDFYSPNNVMDGYELFKILVESGLTPVSVLSGLHLLTMRVRVHNTFVGDLSYVQQNLYKLYKKSAFTHDGLLFRHPFLQFVDQNRSMAYPYENEGREVILHRWEKDFKRTNMLYEFYKVQPDEENIISQSFTSAVKYPSMGKLLNQEFQRNFPADVRVLKPDSKITEIKNVVYTGHAAFQIYKYLYDKIRKRPTLKFEMSKAGIPKFQLDEYFGLSILETSKNIKLFSDECALKNKKLIKHKMPGDMIGDKYKLGNYELIEINHRTPTQLVKVGNYTITVVSINYLIIYAFSHMVKNYNPAGENELSNNTKYMSMYFKLIEMQQYIYSLKTFKNSYIPFYPSIKGVGQEKSLEYHEEFRPPNVNFRATLDKKDVFSNIPDDFQYDKSLFA